MDWIRDCYKTKVQLWQDDPTLYPVRWFWADPNAKILEDTCFYSGNWIFPETFGGGVGERPYRTRDIIEGENWLHLSGQTFCGSLLAAAEGGVHGRDPEIHLGPQGQCDCCGHGWIGEIPLGISTNVEVFFLPNIDCETVLGISTSATYALGTEYFGSVFLGISTSAETYLLPVIEGSTTLGISTEGTAYPDLFVEGSTTLGLSTSSSASLGLAFDGSTTLGLSTSSTTEVDDDVPLIGEVRWIAYGTSLPSKWLDCLGGSVSQGTYAALYAMLGTTWGPATGGNFTLPDLRRRSLVGWGGTQTFGPATTVGSTGGEEGHTLLYTESGLPVHSHPPAVFDSFITWRLTGGTLALGFGSQQWGVPTATGTNTPADAPNAHNTYHPVAVLRPIIYAGV